MAIYVGILGVLIIIAGIIFSRPSDKKIDLQKLLYGACFVLVGVSLLFWASLIRVSDGYVGVIKLGGKAQPEILNSGWHIVTPLAKVIKLDTRTQYDRIVKEVNSISKSNDTLSIVSADGSVIKLGITVAYRLVPSEAATLYNETGLDYKNKLVHSLSVNMASKDAGMYGALSLSPDKWNELQTNINKDIKNEFRRHGLKVEKVLVSNFTPDNNIELAKSGLMLAQGDAKMETKSIEISSPVISRHIAIKKTENTVSNTLPENIAVVASRPSIKLLPKDDNTDELNNIENNIGTINTKVGSNNIVNISANSVEEKTVVAKEISSSDCMPMDEKSFGSAKQMILSTSDNTYKMLTTAEKVITTNCFTSEQVSDFVKLLPTNDSKLEFAKQAYLRTVDRNEFYGKVANNFDKKSKKQLGKYILHLLHRSGPKSNNDVQAGLINEENEMLAGEMDANAFDYFKQVVSASADNDSKLAIAVKIVNCHFLSSEQVLQIVKLLPEVDSRLKFAKEAFARTTDKRMFVKVADYFDKHTRKMLDDYVITMYASR